MAKTKYDQLIEDLQACKNRAAVFPVLEQHGVTFATRQSFRAVDLVILAVLMAAESMTPQRVGLAVANELGDAAADIKIVRRRLQKLRKAEHVSYSETLGEYAVTEAGKAWHAEKVNAPDDSESEADDAEDSDEGDEAEAA